MHLVIYIGLMISTIVGISWLQPTTSWFQERPAGQERLADSAGNISGEWSVNLFCRQTNGTSNFHFQSGR